MLQDTDCHKNLTNRPQTCPKVMVALGGNVASHVGDPISTLTCSIEYLNDSQLEVEKVSQFYATPCFPAGSGPDYVNATATFTGLTDPHAVLKTLHKVEAEFGRERNRRWGRRTLDLDLISVGDMVLPDADTHAAWVNLTLDRQMHEEPDRLILPHPRLQDRAFVLIPLAEIAPDWIHPISGLSVMEMVDALPIAEKSAIRPL